MKHVHQLDPPSFFSKWTYDQAEPTRLSFAFPVLCWDLQPIAPLCNRLWGRSPQRRFPNTLD